MRTFLHTTLYKEKSRNFAQQGRAGPPPGVGRVLWCVQVHGMCRKKVFDIWPTVARELRCIIGLAPLLFASLKPVWFHKAIATDASDTGMGVSTTPASPAALREMSLARPPCDNGPVDRSLHPALRGRKWTDIVSVGWRYPEHINALELHALDTAVRWCASHPTSVGCRLVLWCDNLVVVWGRA